MPPARVSQTTTAATSAAATAQTAAPMIEAAAPLPAAAADGDAQLLALDPEHISAADVRDVLSHAPAPRIINLQGSVALISMTPFAEYLIAMGYPASRLHDPRDGSMSQSSFADSARLAGELAWYYEREGVRPMLIGHSQGGMLAVKVLHELAGTFHPAIEVWNPVTNESEHRTTIVDPLTGLQRPVVGLKLPYVAAMATGQLPRLLLGQWSMMGKLFAIPDTVDEFTGFSIDWDLIAGTYPGSAAFRTEGSALVRNVRLSPWTSHIRMPRTRYLANNPATRAWIDDYDPARLPAPLPSGDGVDSANIVHAADIWYSVKKHWCIEAQRLVRARRTAVASPLPPTTDAGLQRLAAGG